MPVLKSRESWTEELKDRILAAETLVVVDDLYRPYRPKRRHAPAWRRRRAWTGWHSSFSRRRPTVHWRRRPPIRQ